MNPIDVAQAICANAGFDLVGVTGEGSFKNTFHIRANKKSYALKLLKEPPTHRDAREIEAMRRCDHENIAKFVALDQLTVAGETFFFFIEEFLSGGTLTDRLGSLDGARIAQLALALAHAIDHIGSHNLVHRDIKPDNIMFRDASNDRPVIVDFGLVRDLSATSLTATWAMRGPGSPFFAAPEQLNNQKELIKTWTDQFGLGTTLAFALFRSHPFARGGDTDAMTVERVATWQPPSRAFIAVCDDQGVQPLIRMVRPFPVERFRTNRDLLNAWRQVKR